MHRTGKTSFRHRGYQCKHCVSTTMVFGSDPVPISCPDCSETGQLELAWDHWVDQLTKVRDFQEPA